MIHLPSFQTMNGKSLKNIFLNFLFQKFEVSLGQNVEKYGIQFFIFLSEGVVGKNYRKKKSMLPGLPAIAGYSGGKKIEFLTLSS